jgi:hypothetical protein
LAPTAASAAAFPGLAAAFTVLAAVFTVLAAAFPVSADALPVPTASTAQSSAAFAAAVALRLVDRAAAAARDARIEEPGNVHRIEYIGTIAEITAHLDFSSLREHRSRLALAEAL